MKPLHQRIFLIAGAGLLLIVAGIAGYKIHILSERHATIKKDYSVVNSISNGLLSVSVWRDEIMKAANDQINHFKLTAQQTDSLQILIEQVLHAVINKADTLLEKKPKTLGGKLKKAVVRIFVDKNDLNEKAPEFAQTITHQLLKPESRAKLKYLVQSKLRELAADTYDSTEGSKSIRTILNKYRTASLDEFNVKTDALSRELKYKTYVLTFLTIAIVVIFLVAWALLRNHTTLHIPFFIISVLLALELLLVGLTTPMIEIDARIKSLNFQLIGEQISFQHQVIFFQSKSIVDVVHVLLKTGKFDSILVGILILIFSIVFPITKLVATGVYLLAKKSWRKNKFIKFFAFKSGKWSMADVNVIAIFMAYIGFKGILDDQLSSLNIETSSLSSVSTNQTTLQPGYILFVAFVLFGLVLSFILGKITHKKAASKKFAGPSIS
jgi:hypothetical protein